MVEVENKENNNEQHNAQPKQEQKEDSDEEFLFVDSEQELDQVGNRGET